MPQVERKEITTSSVGGGEEATPTTMRQKKTAAAVATTARESIESERRRHKQKLGDEQVASETSEAQAATCSMSAGDCARETFAADSSLTLIDANVASEPNRLLASGLLSDKLQRQSLSTGQQGSCRDTQQSPTSDKLSLSSLDKDKDKFLRLQQKQQDELNNNSIHAEHNYNYQKHPQPPQPKQAQHRLHSQHQPQPVKSSLSPSIKQTQPDQQQHQTQTISPLSLLTGLRMHTNNLRNQQQQLQQTGPKLNSSTSPNTASQASFVESSLNPHHDDDDDHQDGNSPKGQSRLQQQGYIIPSYTSIYSKQMSQQQADNKKSSSQSISTHQRLTTVSVEKEIERTTRQVSARTPLTKQNPLDSSNSATKNLFATLTANTKSQQQQQPQQKSSSETKKLPSVFDYTSGRLKGPVDYDQQNSRGQTDELVDLEAGSSYDENSHLDNHEEEDDDDYLDEHEEDEKSPFRGLAANHHSRPGSINRTTNSSRGRVSEECHQVDNKYQPVSSTKFNRLTKARDSSRRIMSSSSSGKKSSGHQQPQAQQTKISMSDVSRPPAFNTTCQNQQLKSAASCRKLDLLEQVAHLDCHCNACSKNRKLASLHDNLYYHHQLPPAAFNGKLSKFDANSSKSFEKQYPKTRVCHMVLKSIILVLCTLLLLMLLLSAVLLSHYLPQSVDKVVSASRSFNVTIAGR